MPLGKRRGGGTNVGTGLKGGRIGKMRKGTPEYEAWMAKYKATVALKKANGGKYPTLALLPQAPPTEPRLGSPERPYRKFWP